MLIKWEIFKYLYLVRSKVQNRFMEVDFRYFQNLDFIVHLEKEPRKHKLYMLELLMVVIF